MPGVYSNLLTGATGFLGRIIYEHLQAPIIRLGRSPQNDIRCDLSQEVPELPAVHTVIHNAGKAHSVPRSAAEAQAFFDVNEQGTRNLLRGLEAQPPRQFIFISTVAVYGLEQGISISESTPLLGESTYAQSKIKAENAVREWCSQRDIPALILRLPLVYGPNAPGNLGAIRRMIASGRYVRVSNNIARKSIVFGKDVAKLISRIDGQSGTYNLTDGIHPTFLEIENAIAESMDKSIKWNLPKYPLSVLAKFGDITRKLGIPFPLYSQRLQKMTSSLTFDDSAARRDLGWQSNSVVEYIRCEKMISDKHK
jgi:nucleoside-diphosphate-sugar epimerase